MLAVVVLAALVVWRHCGAGLEVPIAAGLIVSLLITPFIHLQDLTVLVLAAWLVLRRRAPLWQWAMVIVGYLIARRMTIAGAVAWAYPMLAFELCWLCSLALLPAADRRHTAQEGRPTQDGSATPAGVRLAGSARWSCWWRSATQPGSPPRRAWPLVRSGAAGSSPRQPGGQDRRVTGSSDGADETRP